MCLVIMQDTTILCNRCKEQTNNQQPWISPTVKALVFVVRVIGSELYDKEVCDDSFSAGVY